MSKPIMFRLAIVSALGLQLLATTALAGPLIPFGAAKEATLQIDYMGQFEVLARDIGSGAGNEQNTYSFGFRRNRIRLVGTYEQVMSVYVQTEYASDETVDALGVASSGSGSNFQILDAAMRFDFHDAFKARVGQFKYNFTRENLEECEHPLTLDRSLFLRAPFVGTRDAGIAVWGNVYRKMFQYRVDMMEGRPAASSETAPKSDFRFSFRGHVSLLDPESEYGYEGSYLGKKKVLTVGAAYQYEPSTVYADTVTKLEAKNYRGWTVDGFAEYPIERFGTATLSAAYEKVDFDDSYITLHPDLGSIGLNGAKNGWYVKAAYMLPEMPLQVFGRVEQWRFAMLNNVYDQGVDWYAVGAHWYLMGRLLKLSAEVSSTNFAETGTFSGVQGENVVTKNFKTAIGSLQIEF